MTEADVRQAILNAIIECEDDQGRSDVSSVPAAKRLRDAVFEALSARDMLKVEERPISN